MEKKSFSIFPIAMAALTAIACCMDGTISQNGTFLTMLSEEIDGLGADKMVLLGLLACFYSRMWGEYIKSSKWITHFLAAVLSGFMVLGMSFSKLGSWAFLFAGRIQMLIAALAFTGYWILFDLCLSLLYGFCSNYAYASSQGKKKAAFREKHPKLSAFAEKHFKLTAFLVILICWLPYLAAFFPGTVSFDGWRQIWMYNGWYPFSNLHPWQATKLIGYL